MMLRAWIPSLIIVWLGVVPLLAWGCGDPGGGTEGFGDGGTSSGGNGSGGSIPGLGGSAGAAGSVFIPTNDGGAVPNPCEAADAPPECMLVSQPGCGDGTINQDSEECDDGNSLPGDCCSGACKVEAYCDCSSGTCVSTIICGDAMRGPGEACDDGNAVGGDGCSADCHVVELGHRCMVPGEACVRFYVCSDGIPDPNEGCDDGNLTPGDGCSERCRIEIGFKCDGMPSTCTATTCGDDIQEGAESCDDGNQVAFDGCSPICRAEPVCPTGEACSSSCGDGIIFGDEACDDGNLRPGDGCSATCTVEDGYECDNDPPCTRRMGVDPETQAMADICVLDVAANYRDFNGKGATSTPHPDFFPGYPSPGAMQGLVQPALDAEGKPVLSSTASEANGYLHGQTNFARWYRDGAPASPPIPSIITLWDKGGATGTGAAGYVNRWGANGEQWRAPAMYTNLVYGGPGTAGAMPGCTTAECAGRTCYDPCTPWGNGSTDACCGEATQTVYDGNPLFFPIDTAPGILNETRLEAKVPEQYGWTGWPWEDDVATTLGVNPPIPTATAPFPTATHNFYFTTEVKYWFKYEADTMATLDFTGDDDMWVFLNGRLAIDLGAWHVPLNGTITINGATINTTANLDVATPPMVDTNPGTAATYGMEPGNVYQIAAFHAERQQEGSSFKLTLAGFNMTPSDCRTNCGDAMVGPGEECDDGTNAGGYNMCAPGCVFGPRCGDGVSATEFGETCDDGDAGNIGTYGGCGADCQPGPRCGDAIVQTEAETCDDGDAGNVGNYGGCAPGCVIGPHCGDNLVQIGFEDCDDANTTNKDGCSNCKYDLPDTT